MAEIVLQSEELQGHEAPVVAAAFSPRRPERGDPRTARGWSASGPRPAWAATTRARPCC